MREEMDSCFKLSCKLKVVFDDSAAASIDLFSHFWLLYILFGLLSFYDGGGFLAVSAHFDKRLW